MKQLVKAKYEAPATYVWEVRTERGILQGSPQDEFSATRDGYGTATTEEWE